MDALLAEVRRRWGDPAANVCDRWREQELRQALEAISFPVCPLIVHGQGYRDGGQDVREFRKACIDERVRPARSLLMRSAMSGARVQTDPAGNAKLAKGGDPCCCGGAADDDPIELKWSGSWLLSIVFHPGRS